MVTILLNFQGEKANLKDLYSILEPFKLEEWTDSTFQEILTISKRSWYRVIKLSLLYITHLGTSVPPKMRANITPILSSNPVRN